MFLYFFVLFYFRITKKVNKNFYSFSSGSQNNKNLQLSNEIVFLIKKSLEESNKKKYNDILILDSQEKFKIVMSEIIKKLSSLDVSNRVLVYGLVLEKIEKNYSFFFKLHAVKCEKMKKHALRIDRLLINKGFSDSARANAVLGSYFLFLLDIHMNILL